MTVTRCIDNIPHEWIEGTPIHTLYGEHLHTITVADDPRLLTLTTVTGKTLTLRGEQHEEAIIFYHVTGTGGLLEVGRWVPVAWTRPLYLRESES